jgi:hypothetical protein
LLLSDNLLGEAAFYTNSNGCEGSLLPTKWVRHPEDTGSNPLGTVTRYIISYHQSCVNYIVMEEEEGLEPPLVSGR